MKSLFSRIPLYVEHFLLRVDEHSLQGPFAYHFISQVVKGNFHGDFSRIEGYRKRLMKSDQCIEYSTFGSTSRLPSVSRKKISQIARSGISSRKKSELFFRIIREYGTEQVLELGTSLGINTCYLAESTQKGRVVTLEGHPQLASVAERAFGELGYSNVEMIVGNIDETLPRVVEKAGPLDFVFVDANHRSEALLRYFEIILPGIHDRSIVVVDDIRWSRDMLEGWRRLIKHDKISHIFEFQDFGVLFFAKTEASQHFLLHF